MGFIQFSDHLIPYETFLNDVAAKVVNMMNKDHDDPEFVSQRQAFKMFGRANVERWRREGKVKLYQRPGKIEYRCADLRLLQRTEQDYLGPNSH